MSKKRDNYIPLLISAVCLTLLFFGKVDIADESNAEFIQPLTPIEKSTSISYYSRLTKDVVYFARNYTKLNTLTLNRQIKSEIVPNIQNLSDRLSSLRVEETSLNNTLNSIPREEYVHSKLELSSFIIDELKKANMVYEIDYNYTQSTEVINDGSASEETQPLTGFSNQFRIKVLQLNRDDNYEKLNKILDTIFIKEPYEIVKVNIEYDSELEDYIFSIIIQV